jgi:heme exporter protein A
MNMLAVEGVAKRYGHRRVLTDIAFSLTTGDSLAIVGPNGCGKTTLLRLVAGLTPPSRGTITFTSDGRRLDRSAIRHRLSYIGPELTLYDPLTAGENLAFFAAMRGIALSPAKLTDILDRVGLIGRGDDLYREYSSGMKQRLKYAVALLNDPVFLLLDEPTANLDAEGKEIVASIIARQKEIGILLVATNEQGEYGFADRLYRLDG